MTEQLHPKVIDALAFLCFAELTQDGRSTSSEEMVIRVNAATLDDLDRADRFVRSGKYDELNDTEIL